MTQQPVRLPPIPGIPGRQTALVEAWCRPLKKILSGFALFLKKVLAWGMLTC